MCACGNTLYIYIYTVVNYIMITTCVYIIKGVRNNILYKHIPSETIDRPNRM